MSATTWLIIAIVGFSLSGIALVAAIFMFIKMNIPAVIGDLSGKTLAREIKAIRSANATSTVHTDHSRSNTGKQQESLAKASAHTSKQLNKTGSGISSSLPKSAPVQAAPKPSTTESLSTNVGEVDIEQRRATAVLAQNKATDVLTEAPETAVLSEAQPVEIPQTAVLSEAQPVEIPQTEVLTEAQPAAVPQTEVLTEAQPAAVPQTEVLTEAQPVEIPQTEVLTDSDSVEAPETMVLSEPEEHVQPIVNTVAFKVTKSVIMIHTDEVI